ncbi:palmitoyltransferase ZDHHC2-like [Haemaphysalis longicornis]
MFNALFALVLWCYLYTALADPAPIPAEFSVDDVERQQLEWLTGLDEREDYLDELGYRCIAKMDHHCPWFNNCVSFTNYKSFLLTITYSTLLGIFTLLTAIPGALKAWFSLGLCLETLQVNVLVVCSALISVSLGLLVPIHVDFVLRNVTTLENLGSTVLREADDSFNIGWKRNFVQVFGPQILLWPLPVFSSVGDGVRFPTVLHPDPYHLSLHRILPGRGASSASKSSMLALRHRKSQSKRMIEASDI